MRFSLLVASCVLFSASVVGSRQCAAQALPAMQRAVLEGRVTLAGDGRGGRVFRGSRYRNRLARNPQGDDPTAGSSAAESAYANVIVSAHPLTFTAPAPPLAEPARVEQRDATFMPHVTPVTVGSTVAFVNDDPFYHNVFSLTPGARFNIGRRPTGDVVYRRITYVEVTGLGEINLFCDIHAQMNAVVLSLDTPYYTRVSNDGAYRITGLPAGRYEIRVYHPDGTATAEVVILEDDSVVQEDFTLSQ